MKQKKNTFLLTKIFFFGAALFFYPSIAKANIVDDTQSEFTSGTQLNTQWDSGNSWLEMDGTGLSSGFATFTSRIIDVGSSASWSTFSFVPQRPILKELPDSGSTETAYNQGNVDMSNNTALYHFNSASGNATDSSGNSRTGSATNITYSGLGRFHSAFTFNSNGLVNTSLAASNFVSVTTKSISVWLYPTQAPAVNGGGAVYNGQRIIGDDSAYFGIYITQLVGDDQKIYAYNWGSGAQSVGTTYNLNEWVHIVMVHTDGNLYIYKNGALVGTVGSSTTGSLTADLHIGDFYSAGLQEGYIGKMDELATWNRALSSTEILDMYKRGALRVKHQVRSCNDAACSGESFVGQGGSTSNFFEEQDSNTISLPSFSLSGVVGSNQYFQYRTVFESSDASYSPEIKSITLGTDGTEAGGGGGGGGDVGVPEFSDFVYFSTILVAFWVVVKKLVPALRSFFVKKWKQKSVCA